MANTLSALTSDLYKAAEIVGAEGVGVLNSVVFNTGSESAAQGESIKSITTEEPTVNTSATPSMTIPQGDDQVFGEKSFDLDQVVNVQLNITGEEEVKIDTHHSFDSTQGNRFLRAFRQIRNTIEASAAAVIYKQASRAFGTAGTTPFSSNFDDVAEVRQILFDNGFWMQDEMSLVVNSLAGTNLRQLATLTGVNTAGSDDTLRRGELLNLQGFSLKESAGIASHTKGTGGSYLVDDASHFAIGSTALHFDTGTGTFIAGDVITIADDPSGTTRYVVATGAAGDGDVDVVIGAPGAQGLLTNNKAVTIGSDYTANLAICRSCVEVAARPQKAPSDGDAAVDVVQVPDPYTGLVYEVREYRGYKKAMWDITLVYNTKVWQPEGVAILLG